MEIILASGSPSRLELLNSINISPSKVIIPNIDETSKKGEKPIDLVKRLAEEKCHIAAQQISNAIIIAADTIVICKRKILDKAISDNDVANYLSISSSSRNRVITSVCILKKINDEIVAKKKFTNISIIKFKAISRLEIYEYVKSQEGIGKAGGIAIAGCAASFIKWIHGSHSGIIGLPLCETKNALLSLGYENKS